MAEYIFDVMSQTSKLDWAFPFQRTGAFPIDRSAVFSSLEDAEKYALGLDDNKLPRDERGLGGTSYVGQVISVYEAGEGDVAATVSAYIITPARGLMKLAATTASGDIAGDVANLQGQVANIIDSIESIEEEVAKKAVATEVEEALNLKADASTVNEALALKADASAMETALNLKANASDVETSLDLKADKTYVDDELAKKAVASEVETALNLKANASDVEAALALKANASDMAEALALKANAADVYSKEEVYTKSEVETYVANEIGSAGHLNREIVEALPEVASADVDTIYMVKKSGGLVDRDHYEEYMVINGAWEMIGDTFVDLSNYVDNDTLNTEIGVIEAAIALKADASALEATNAEVAKKANAETVNAALDLKANTADVNSALDLKANKSEVESALDLKADKSQVEQDIANAVAPLAIKSEMEAALALKANVAEVEAAMALKADKTKVEAVAKSLEDHEAAATEAMALKADLSYVNEELAKKADKATTLAGYGISDAYTKGEVDAALLLKASQQDHNELVDEVNKKANAVDVYAKGETYSRQEIADLIADITGGESAADVLAALNTYKGTNDERVGAVEDRVKALEELEADDNVIEAIKLAGATAALQVSEKTVTIPAATAEAYGLVKLSAEVGVNEAGALEVKTLNANKLYQEEGEWLILNGGNASL